VVYWTPRPGTAAAPEHIPVLSSGVRTMKKIGFVSAGLAAWMIALMGVPAGALPG